MLKKKHFVLPVFTCLLIASADPLFADQGSLNHPENSNATATNTAGSSIGPDVIVHAVSPGINSYGSEVDPVSGERIHAFSVGMTACNIGDDNAIWFDHTNQHPVIAQNLYRLKSGRFEQIGMSWLLHTFFAVDGSACGTCTAPEPHDGNYLYAGCSNPEGAGIAGTQNNLGPRSTVNASTGFFPYPFNRNHQMNKIVRRLQVGDTDIDATLNTGALFFAEGHFVTTDEPAFGNHFNNASYRRVAFARPGPENNNCNNTLFSPSDWCGIFSGSTQREKAAIRAWKENDPSVVETDVFVPGEGLFILAAKATDLENGFWHYEYAVQNLNSHRSAGSFRVPLPVGAVVENIGFHAPFYHSGEPYDGTDWTAIVLSDSIVWGTTPYDTNPNANALRWGTLYNFRFDANVAPEPRSIQLGLFRPGVPGHITAETIGPSRGFVDCNDNLIPDHCEIGFFEGCPDVPGFSPDCNDNLVPDGCEPDCNGNRRADECDPDCDANSVPDDCETSDEDQDGVADCDDLCPLTSPPDSCVCPAVDGCCYPTGFCIHIPPGINRDACITQGGTPFCVESPCRDGCLVGDFDLDGDLDLHDYSAMLTCFSGYNGSPGYSKPSPECLLRFDFDADNDVDADDGAQFLGSYAGP